MDVREEFVSKLIVHPDARMLELGPLNRPILNKADYPNCRYCDIRSTEEIKVLYSGNAYLEATGVWVDTETITEIDDVIVGSYSEYYANAEKFDVVVASHVLEHMDDLIFSMRDIGGILRPGGLFCVVYPDKRYCFDHFRQSASFRDAYAAFHQGRKRNANMVLDFFLSSVQENNPALFWGEEKLEYLLHTDDGAEAFRYYEAALNGERMDDVHYWPFTDRDFLQFLYDGVRTRLLPFRCVNFCPTPENDQQFMLALRYDPSVPCNTDEALSGLTDCMTRARPSFYRSEDRIVRETVERLQQELSVVEEDQTNQTRKIVQQEAQIAALQETKAELAHRLAEQIEQIEVAQKANTALQRSEVDLLKTQMILLRRLEQQEQVNLVERTDHLNIIAALKTIENSTIWRATKPLRWMLDALKGNNKGSN